MIKLSSLGIDLSPSATGVVLLQNAGAPTPDVLIESEIKFTKLTGIDRNKSIVAGVMEIVSERNPDRIVVEGYSLNLKNASSVIPLVELGGLLRFCLQLDGHKWLDPRASEIKKFVTSSGNADKAKVMMGVLKRWGHESKTNNTADAYAAACMGLAHMNALPGATVEQRTIVGKLAFVCN